MLILHVWTNPWHIIVGFSVAIVSQQYPNYDCFYPIYPEPQVYLQDSLSYVIPKCRYIYIYVYCIHDMTWHDVMWYDMTQTYTAIASKKCRFDARDYQIKQHTRGNWPTSCKHRRWKHTQWDVNFTAEKHRTRVGLGMNLLILSDIADTQYWHSQYSRKAYLPVREVGILYTRGIC